MDIFLSVLKNRAPQWNIKIAFIFLISLALFTTALRIRKMKNSRMLGAILIFCYIFNVLVTTLLMRSPVEGLRYTLSVNFLRQIFVEHNAFAISEAILNFLLLFPVGVFMPLFFGKFATLKTCVFGFGLTLFIECTQLVTHLGEFQSDDLILNYLGCCAGAWLTAAIVNIRNVYRTRKRTKSAGENEGL